MINHVFFLCFRYVSFTMVTWVKMMNLKVKNAGAGVLQAVKSTWNFIDFINNSHHVSLRFLSLMHLFILYIYIFFICLLLSEVRGTFQFILLLRNSAEIKRRVCRLLLLFFVYKVFIKLMVKICSLKKIQHYFKNCFPIFTGGSPLFLDLFSTSLNIFLNC